MEGAAEFPDRGARIPAGLGLITVALFAMAIVNLFTKKIATIWGLTFTLTIFVIFTLCEHYNRRRRTHSGELERFRLDTQGTLSRQSVKVRQEMFLLQFGIPMSSSTWKSA